MRTRPRNRDIVENAAYEIEKKLTINLDVAAVEAINRASAAAGVNVNRVTVTIGMNGTRDDLR